MTQAYAKRTMQAVGKETRRPVDILGWSMIVISGGIVFPISLVLLDWYSAGDQFFYAKLYQSLAGVAFWEAPELTRRIVSGNEPLFGLLMWVGANAGIEKNVWIAVFNALLGSTMVAAMRRAGAGPLLIVMCLSSFYFLVLLTGAERLKFGVLMLFAALATQGVWRYVFLAAAPLFHFQTLLVLLSLLSEHLGAARRIRWIFRRPLVAVATGVVGLAAVIAFVVALGPAVLGKAAGYASGAKALDEHVNLVGLIGIGVIIARRRTPFLLAMAPVLLASAMVGPARVNMIGVAIFLFYFLREGQGRHPLLYMLMLYFCWRSIDFVEKIYLYSTGFG